MHSTTFLFTCLIMTQALLAPGPVSAAENAPLLSPYPVPHRVYEDEDSHPGLVTIDSFREAGSSLTSEAGFAMEDYYHGTLVIMWKIKRIGEDDAKPPRNLLGHDGTGYDIHDDGLLILVEPDRELAELAISQATASGFALRSQHLGGCELVIIGKNPDKEAEILAVLHTVVDHASATAAAPASAPTP